MKKFYLISLFLLASLPCWCLQQATVESNEKIHIALDKPYHAAGEEMRVAVFLLNGVNHQLIESSAIVYVELFHPQGGRLLSHAIKTEEGRGLGRFLLPDSLSGGIYRMVAFTKGMAREGVAVNWKDIFVDGEKTLKKYVEEKESSAQLSFFPEAGSLVEGLENLVAVRLMNAPSGELAGEGEVINKEGEVMATFSTSAGGTGSFLLTPEPEASYSGRLSVNGTLFQAPLPSASREGYVLRVDDGNPDSLRIEVRSSPSLYGQNFTLRILSRSRVILETAGKARYHGYKVKVPVASLLPGVGYVQLLSEEGKLLASRSVYLEESNQAVASLILPESHFSTRAPVKLVVQVRDEKGRPLKASLTASVYDKKYASLQAHGSGIHQQLLVASELGATAAAPEIPSLQMPYNIGQAQEMDHFLLTALTDTLFQYKPKEKEEYLNVLEGRVMLKRTAEPLADTTIIVGMVSKNQIAPVLLLTKTDAEGRFRLALPVTNISSSVNLKVKGVDELQDLIDYQVDEKQGEPVLLNKIQTGSRYDLQNVVGYHKTFVENKIIKEAFGISPVRVLEDSSNLLSSYGFQYFDAVYKMDEYQVLPTLRDVIIDILSGVKVRRHKGSYRIIIDAIHPVSGEFLRELPGEPLLLLDGVPVNNPDLLFDLSPADIVKIEIARDTWYIGELPVNGIFAITTRNKAIHQRKDLNQYRYTSIGIHSSFQYEFSGYPGTEDSSSAQVPDFRPLLYYQPFAETNKEGEVSFLFYTADDVGTFRIAVEGITEDGKPFSAFKDITVDREVE